MKTAFDLLNYIESHSAIVQAISTVLLVLITGWYVYLMKKLIVTTKEAKRPYVFVELQGEGAFFLEIVIQNSGEMSAENVKFKIIKDLVDSDGKNLSTYVPFKLGFATIPPQRRYKYDFFVSNDFFKKPPNELIFELDVEYKSGTSKYEDKFSIDLAPFRSLKLSSFIDSMEQVAGEIKMFRSEYIRNRGIRPKFGKKQCPICFERIELSAKKCPNCLEFIPNKSDEKKEGD